MTPIELYQQDIRERGFLTDSAQALAVEKTQTLYETLLQTPQTNKVSGFLRFLSPAKINAIKGLYCWGGVGRGKSHLIDGFFDCLPFKEKKRIHFRHFMQDIHSKLEKLPKTPDPLVIIAKELASQYRIICIDEFHVTDITDAMIMAGFLHALYAENITLVWTSNSKPEWLYKNGLQRSRFLPAIELIKQFSDVIELDNGKDYRLALLEQQGTYHVLQGQESTDVMLRHLLELTGEKTEKKCAIRINGREIQTRIQTPQLIWFDFKEICQTARSSKDYILLAQDYETLLISDVPAMNDAHNDVVQRFIQLIDALYDQRVKLVATAYCKPDLIYQGKSLEFPFKRTLSRLFEMRSKAYLSKAHSL